MKSFIVGLFVLVVYVASTSGQAYPKWTVNPVDLLENGNSKWTFFKWFKLGWPKGLEVICQVKNGNSMPKTLVMRVKNKWVPLSTLPNFALKNSRRVLGLRLRALKDKICNDRKFTLVIRCAPKNKPLKAKSYPLTINIKNTEPASACQDPHLTQKVNGLDEDGEAVTKNICYDLFGKSGEQTELMTDKVLGTSIVFELRDDYYIGKAFYSTKLGFFNFTTTAMSWPKTSSKDGSSWGKEEEFVVGEIDSYPHAIVKQDTDDVLIEYKEEGRSQSVRIAKVNQGIGKNYLNILLEHSTNVNGVFDKFHGGLFGFIANQQYEFYDPVQTSSNDKADLTVVKINGRFVKAFLTGNGDETDRCYSMRLDDLLFPKNVYSFQKSL